MRIVYETSLQNSQTNSGFWPNSNINNRGAYPLHHHTPFLFCPYVIFIVVVKNFNFLQLPTNLLMIPTNI